MDNYNEDELNPPSWLDADFIKKVLKTNEKSDDVKIKDLQIKPATLKGEHFASIMFRASVRYNVKSEEKDISIIIKTMPVEDGMKKDMLQNLPMFETESTMYSEVIPKFHSILREHGDNTILAAKLLYCSLSPHKVIMLEDLSKKGFTVFKTRLANFEEAQKILDKICKWHAISFKLLKEGNSSLDNLRDGVFNRGLDAFGGFFKIGLELFGETLSSFPNGKIYEEKYKKIQSKILEKCQLTSRKTGDLCVLNHSDFHLKNMMFKWKDNSEIAEEMILVDFQFCVVAPLAIDLTYMLNMVVDTDLRLNRDKLILAYHEKFVETLHKIKFKGNIPSAEDIRNEMLKHKHFDLLLVAACLPFTNGAWIRGEIDLNEVLNSKEACAPFYKAPDYVNELKVLLPRMLENGYFDE